MTCRYEDATALCTHAAVSITAETRQNPANTIRSDSVFTVRALGMCRFCLPPDESSFLWLRGDVVFERYAGACPSTQNFTLPIDAGFDLGSNVRGLELCTAQNNKFSEVL